MRIALALALFASLLPLAADPPEVPDPPEPETEKICFPYIGCINI